MVVASPLPSGSICRDRFWNSHELISQHRRAGVSIDDDTNSEASSSMPTPRKRQFMRRSGVGPPSMPLLQVAAGVNGRLRLATSTKIIITNDSISYVRYTIPTDQIERVVRMLRNHAHVPHGTAASP